MHVLHVHSGNLFGGVERMMQALAPAAAGLSPVRSSFALCFEGGVSEALRAAQAEVHVLGAVRARRPDEIRRARRSLRPLLNGPRPDVALVHSAWSQAIFGPTILKSGTPLVRWLHAPAPGPVWMETWAARSQPALVLCNSRYTLENAGKRFGNSPLTVQYPATLAPPLHSARRGALRAELGTRPDAVVIVLAARLEEGKGHAPLIDALARLRSRRWEAWIAGGVQQRSEQAYLEDLCARAVAAAVSDRVRFLGQRSDVADLLTAADIYCQPNTAPDSFGLSFVEALAAGLPVITTRLGAAPEILDESCGVLIEPDAPERVSTSLAAALDSLIERGDERERMGAAARLRASAFCDLAGSTSRLADHLSRIVTPSLAHA